MQTFEIVDAEPEKVTAPVLANKRPDIWLLPFRVSKNDITEMLYDLGCPSHYYGWYYQQLLKLYSHFYKLYLMCI